MWRALWLALAALLLMTPRADAGDVLRQEARRTVEIRIGARQWAAIQDDTRFLDIEGAFRSAKTWTVLIKIRLQVEEYPGIRWAIARWTEDGLHGKLIPDWRNVCALLGLSHGVWNADESCFEFPRPGVPQAQWSRVYAIALKTQRTADRYAKVRGLTIAGFYLDQLEEVPEDVYDECALRLSQPGYPQQMIVTPNPVPETHWIAKNKWRVRKPRPLHAYHRLSIWDNAHNLAPETIAAAETLYPVGHPARPTKLEGRRGLDVKGTPVYAGAFVRSRHLAKRPLAVNPSLPLCEAYDFGFRHPCVVWYQWAPWGWIRLLGGVLGENMHLDAFLPIVARYRTKWFGERKFIEACCDPAGANENSQGVRGKPVAILREWYRKHGHPGVVPVYKKHANTPEARRAAVDVAATYMRHRAAKEECFLVDPEHWMLVRRDEVGELEERFESFMVDGFELGYVLEEEPRHSSKLGTFYVPLKDGWFEHPMNCFEYGVQQHVLELPDTKAASDTKVKEHLAEVEARARQAERDRLHEDQADPDGDVWPADGTVPAYTPRRPGNRAGY